MEGRPRPGNGRRRNVADGHLRSGNGYVVLADRQSVSRTPTAASRRATTSTPTHPRARREDRNACAGTISSRRTTCGTGTRRSRLSWSTPASRARRASCCCRPIATGFSTCSIARTGKLLLARPFVQKLTWASGIGPDGRPQLLPGNLPDAARCDDVSRRFAAPPTGCRPPSALRRGFSM